MFELTGKYGNAMVYAETCDQETISQIITLLNQPFVSGQTIRIMPDCHAGKGCVIGTTMTISDRIVPNLVGVDLNCGMLAIRLDEREVDLPKLDEVINTRVPSGFSVHDRPVANAPVSKIIAPVDTTRALRSLGTLGGGNHFIELDKDEEGYLWLVIHTGSRHLGVEVAGYYQKIAIKELYGARREEQELIARLRAEGRQAEIQDALAELRKYNNRNVPDELCWVADAMFDDYLHDVDIARIFAQTNRQTIADIILTGMGWHVTDGFDTLHNYVDTEHMILRKGSISAQKGERVLIPMNMRDGSLVCIGKGNPDWNYSAPHGAGRILSRSKAKSSVALEDFEKSMEGIYSTSVSTSTLDESPMAYKPAEEIMRCIGPTVEVISVLKPIYNFKAH